jgi:predicted nucleic acid-binding protein
VATVIVLDASVLIAYLDSADRHHVAAQALLEASLDDELGVNTLTLAEVLVVPARDGRLDEVRQVLNDIDVRELPFPVDAAGRLATLRTRTGLKMPDCCVLLAAETHTASVASFDERLIAAAEHRKLPIRRQSDTDHF